MHGAELPPVIGWNQHHVYALAPALAREPWEVSVEADEISQLAVRCVDGRHCCVAWGDLVGSNRSLKMHRLNSGDQAGGRVAGMGCSALGHQPGDNSGIETSAGPAVRNPFRQAANLWWSWLIAGIFWVVAALVVLQFDGASITAVGVMIGFMFLLVGLQNLLFGAFVSGAARWILWIFGVLFLVAGVVLMISPEETFARVADILGFIFLLVGIFWLLEALTERDPNELWWFGLISGIAMLIVAFWTGGQFFIEKQYVLLVFTGILSLFHGVSDLIKAFEIRQLRDLPNLAP